MARSRLRLHFVGGVDPRLKREVIAFGRWLREWYTFAVPFDIRLVNQDELIDFDDQPCALRWWQSDLGSEPVTGELAVGTFPSQMQQLGPTWAYPTVIAAIGRLVKYYFQAVQNSPLREDYAEAWGDKLLDAYVDDLTPPPPYPGAKLRDPDDE